MSGSEIQNLLVRIEPEGVDDTTEQLDQMGDQFEESAEQTEDAASMLEDFSSAFKGAASVIIAGLATLAAGLLSRIPIIGEAAAGLIAIVEAIALVISQTFRPALQPLIVGLFGIGDAVLRTKGPLSDFIGVLGGMAVVGALLAPLVAFTGIISGPLAVAIVLITGLIGALSVAWQQNWLNIQQILRTASRFIQQQLNSLVSLVRGIWTAWTGFMEGDWEQMWSGIQTALGAAASLIKTAILALAAAGLKIFGELVIGMISLGLKLGNRLRAIWNTIADFVVLAIKTMANKGLSAAETLTNGIISMVNDAIGALEGLINRAAKAAKDVPGVNIGKVSLGRLDQVDAGQLSTRSPGQILAQNERQLGRADAFAGRATGEARSQLNQQVDRLVNAMLGKEQVIELNIDGRKAAESTQPFIGSDAEQSGRSGTR